MLIRAGRNLGFFQHFVRFSGFLKVFQVLTCKCRTLQNYDPQAKIRPCERHKSQFIFEYHCIKLVTQLKKKLLETKIQTLLENFRLKN